jgi:hypothetical protein
MRKCTDCFYCRKGSIVTYQAVNTCLHPIVRAQDPVNNYPQQCHEARAAEKPCGPQGDLFRMATDLASPIPDINNFRH